MSPVLPILFGLRLIVPGEAPAPWDWQLTEPYDLAINVRTLALDADAFGPEVIAALKSRGVKPVCYVSVGTWEAYRDDADLFPEAVLGNTLGRWPDERHLDTRQHDVLLPIMKARIDRCAAKGFLAVEPDNMDGFENDTGFPLTMDTSLAYIREIIAHTHGLGLEIAQKNTPELVPALVAEMDFVIVESCFKYRFCQHMLPYRAAGKDVLAAEYSDAGLDWDAVCAEALALGFHLLLKDREIAAGGKTCR